MRTAHRTMVSWCLATAVLTLSAPAALAETRRIWIDTDAACGVGPRTDPDDCLAILALARTPGIEITGISTVFGNAALDAVDTLTRALVYEIAADGGPLVPVHRGASEPFNPKAPGPTAASRALAAELAARPLTIVALGPVTNIATALSSSPDLSGNIENLIGVMGRREGHAFHPAEGASGGMLFGHGPVFRDFNVCQDEEAVRLLLGQAFAITLVPYELARQVEIGARDLGRLADAGGASAWVGERSRGWLAYWQADIGRAGFYPFDLLAAEYVAAPDTFDCAAEPARVALDREMFGPLMPSPGLLVGRARAGATRHVLYCTRHLGTGIRTLDLAAEG